MLYKALAWSLLRQANRRLWGGAVRREILITYQWSTCSKMKIAWLCMVFFYTGISSQIRTKLREWAICQARAGCYSGIIVLKWLKDAVHLYNYLKEWEIKHFIKCIQRLWNLHQVSNLIPSNNLGNIECAMSESCGLLLSGHCGHIGLFLGQLWKVSGCRAVAHGMDQQHLVNWSRAIINNIVLVIIKCIVQKVRKQTLHLRSISGECGRSLAYVDPSFSVECSF